MEAEVIKQERTSGLSVQKHLPFPNMERLVVGILAGASGGILTAASNFYMEGVPIVGFLLTPFFALVGACCGVLSKHCGWGKVSPLVLGMFGGIVHFETPMGWVIGGMVGGLINGVICGSMRKTVKGLLVGGLVGLLGWGIVWAYLFVTVYGLKYFLD
jgi:hypothetical protein